MGSRPFSHGGFSGVVRVGDESWAFGNADRANEVPNTVDTQFAIASGAKGFTALVAVSTLPLALRVRELLGEDLPLVDDRVTVEHLLRHRSGIGDYVDEDVHEDFEAYLMPVPVHELATTLAYLPVLEGHPQKFTPGERFTYCNSGFVVLALLAERASGRSFYDLVDELICELAGMRDTRFFARIRSRGRRQSATSPTGERTCSICRYAGAGTAASTRRQPIWRDSGSGSCSTSGSSA